MQNTIKLRTLDSSFTTIPYGRPICLADETFRADSFVQIINRDLFTHGAFLGGIGDEEDSEN